MGHPTPWPWLNELLVFPNLALWLPFRRYQASHIAHHRDERLTDPYTDPESYYVSRSAWQAMNVWQRGYFWLYNTAAGRLLIGPLHAVIRLFYTEWQHRNRRDFLRVWLPHIGACALVIAWLNYCQMSILYYLVGIVYPAMALSLLRAYPEHRARPDIAQRTAIVEAHPLLALLYLNNNLHAVHHREPRLSWYRIPQRWRAQHADILAANADYYFCGYAEVLARYLLRPRERPDHG